MPEEENNGSPIPENANELQPLTSSSEDLYAKIVELTKQLTDVEGMKKSADKGFNDQIKDIKAEIKMTLDLLKRRQESDNVR